MEGRLLILCIVAVMFCCSSVVFAAVQSYTDNPGTFEDVSRTTGLMLSLNHSPPKVLLKVVVRAPYLPRQLQSGY